MQTNNSLVMEKFKYDGNDVARFRLLTVPDPPDPPNPPSPPKPPDPK